MWRPLKHLALLAFVYACAPVAAQAGLPERTCDLSRLGAVPFELCEARRLDEAASRLRIKASTFETMARQRNSKCDVDAPDPAKLVGCDMAVRDMTREAGFMRLEAADLEAQADAHRAQAEAMRAKVREKAKTP